VAGTRFEILFAQIIISERSVLLDPYIGVKANYALNTSIFPLAFLSFGVVKVSNRADLASK
jgi:hypothetical protein